jgi:hypothetical protein
MEPWAIIVGVLTILSALAWMAWRAKSASAELAQPTVRRGIPTVDRAKVDANIARYKRAIEQNVKGRVRETELRRELDYWKTLDIALRARGE